MAVSSAVSLLLSATLSLLVLAGMQMYKVSLSSSAPFTIAGGFLGSILFILLVTAVGNLEAVFFGKGFQMQLFPEVSLCLLVSMFACALIHRVCVTTCLLFSAVALHYINKLSQSIYSVPITVAPTPSKSKKRN